MKAWEYHNRIVRERQAQEAVATLRTAQAASPGSAPKAPDFALLLTALEQECRQLSALPRGAARTERKRALVAEFSPVVARYIDGGERYENTALTQVMIWAFDIGDIDLAMRLARVAVAENQPLPERYKRDIRTAVADMVLEWAATRGEQPIEPYFSEIYAEIFPQDDADVSGWQIHDDIRVKYVKRAIDDAEKAGQKEKALELCNFAEKIDPKIAKVATRKKSLEKEIAKQQESLKFKEKNLEH